MNAETTNVTEAWKVLSIPRQTLNDWIPNKDAKVGAGRNTELSNEEEELLVDNYLLMAKSSHLFTVLLMNALGWSTVKKKDWPTRSNANTGPTSKWWIGFKKHHPKMT